MTEIDRRCPERELRYIGPDFTDAKIIRRTINKGDVEPSFREAIFKALGRPLETSDHLYIVGSSTNDEAINKAAHAWVRVITQRFASAAANKIKWPKGQKEIVFLVTIFELPNHDEKFLSVGGLGSLEKAAQYKTFSLDVALDAFKNEPSDINAKVVEWASAGQLVKADQLFELAELPNKKIERDRFRR